MPQELARRMGMGESRNEKPQIPYRVPCSPVEALIFVANGRNPDPFGYAHRPRDNKRTMAKNSKNDKKSKSMAESTPQEPSVNGQMKISNKQYEAELFK